MQAIILAGGKGSRLRAEVPDLPKPLALVDGRPFLEHQMAYWVAQGVDRFVLSVGYKAQMIIDQIGSRFGDASVVYAVEQQPLGTGGALLLAVQQLQVGEPFLVLNGDTFFDLPLSQLRSFHEAKRSSWTLGLFPGNDTGRYLGVTLDEGGRLISLAAPLDRKQVWANAGVYMISPGALNSLAGRFKGEVSLENTLFPAMLESNSAVFGFCHSGRFIDIGLPSDYRRAAEVLSRPK